MLVVFDLDNTLGDREAAVRAWMTAFCAERALPAEATDWLVEVDNDGYSDRREVFAAIADRYGLDSSVEELVADYQRRIIGLTPEVDGATETLHVVRDAGHRIAIVTNGSAGQQHAKIDHLGFRELVDAVCVSGELGIKKPDRRIFEAAATLADSTLDGAWMIGDSPHHDVTGAQLLGIRTIWISRGRSWDAALEPPTAIVDQLVEIIDLLPRARPPSPI